MKLSRLDLLLAGAVAAFAMAGGTLLLRTRLRRDPEAAERKRRQQVGRVGRITLGEILDVVEAEAEAPLRRKWKPAKALHPSSPLPPRHLAVYRYSIAGVSYETAQDLSDLWSRLAAPTPGQMARVKYDPANPSNSILAAENWVGLNAREPATVGGKGK